MAARKSYLNFGGGDRITPINTESTQFEFDESEFWMSTDEGLTVSSGQSKRSSSIHSSGLLLNRKPSRKPNSGNVNQRSTAATSLPVNVPDWSRILGKEYANRQEDDADEDIGVGVGDEQYCRLPPHEYLARTRGSSFSVHEGIGRTLKGRDLSRLRNAVWKQTGFED